MIKIFGTETQETIAAWALEAFGDVKTTRSILTRAGCEMAELVHAIECEEPVEKIAGEIADVIIVLCLYPTVLAAAPWRGSGEPAAAGDASVYARWAAEDLNHNILHGCVFWLAELALALRIDIGAAIDAKMIINRARKWVRKGAGHGQHVAEAPEPVNAHDRETLRLAHEYRDACVAVQVAWRALLAEMPLSEPVSVYTNACEHARVRGRALRAHASDGVPEIGQ